MPLKLPVHTIVGTIAAYAAFGAFGAFATAPQAVAEIHLAQGVMAGEVTATTALLQTRLTAVEVLTNGQIPGADGGGYFEIATDPEFSNPRRTPWLAATAGSDFILRARIDGLRPSTTYHYRVVFGAAPGSVSPGPPASFKTLPDPDSAAPSSFIVTSCFNYAFFHDAARGAGDANEVDRKLGYPALEPILGLQPDFVILNGDCVYYDHPVKTRAKTLPEMRAKWHEQFAQPRFIQLFARVPTYWLKDDHDYRINDGDPTGDYPPSHDLGIATFLEQAPIAAPTDPSPATHRTHRIGRDLQLWFVEGRDHRSPNAMPDGPEKSIWGAAQKAWLERTLKESDATFKILISPTPMIGPDDAYKKDNHTNADGFRHEGEAFFVWLKENGIAPGRFFILCGDRHWKYHSRHPTGFEEFSCGALNRENARLGRAPGTKGSTDPDGRVTQLYTDKPASGGFLRVALTPTTADQSPALEFTHHDAKGEVLHRHQAR
jgi:alkaline phosphatase D